MKKISKILAVLLSLAVIAGVLFTNAFAAGNRAGDADLDGDVDVEDALVVLRSVAGENGAYLTAEQRTAADVTYDGTVNSVDALRILLYVSGHISSLDPVGGEEGDDIII